MINISPSTLSVIAAALSGERAFTNATHSQIEEALQSLLPGNRTEKSSVELQPGEYYLVVDDDDRHSGIESYHTLTDFKSFVDDMQEEMEDRDFDDRFQVYIIRRQVSFHIERKTKVVIK